MHLGSDCSRF